MYKIVQIVIIGLLISACSNNKIVLLPEIETAEITTIKDVSPAYIFYNEALPDSIELNRKNLIITTNWLVNVDKRLTLKQAIPKITFLQDKKRNAKMHKNEAAKNYYTCNDLSKGTLGFIEFTDVVYEMINIIKDSTQLNLLKSKEEYRKAADFHARSILSIIINEDKSINIGEEVIEINQLQKKISFFLKDYNFIGFNLDFYFNKNMNFQDYITCKTYIESLKSDVISISNKEFIY